MKTNLKYLLYAAGCALLAISCKQDPPPSFHFEYFGLEQGRYIIYDVTEINHDHGLSVHDTAIYQLKTVWGEVYEDNEGRLGREYLIYRRDSLTGPWISVDVWYGLYDGIRAELIEENQRRVKLVFAPTISKEWDANAYNVDDELPSYYRDIHGDTTLNGTFFDSTLVVEQEDVTNLIESVRKYEMYAKHYGLVYRHFKDNVHQIGLIPVFSGYEAYWVYSSSGWE